MPTRGGAIQLANWPGSTTRCIRLPMKSPSSLDGSHWLESRVQVASSTSLPAGETFTSLNSPISRWKPTCGSSSLKPTPVLLMIFVDLGFLEAALDPGRERVGGVGRHFRAEQVEG